jgi:drug/metabolite transporter (DMT)-like permease
MLVTAFYIAPVIHSWFDFLGKLPLPAGLSDPVKAAAMMIVDQTFGAVGVTIGFFYAFELVSVSQTTYINSKTE